MTNSYVDGHVGDTVHVECVLTVKQSISVFLPHDDDMEIKTKKLLNKIQRSIEGNTFAARSQYCDIKKSTNEGVKMESQDKSNESSPPHEKRMLAAVVTPAIDIEKGRKKSKYGFKKGSEIIPTNMMSNACHGYMVSLRGNIDLFYFDQGQTEAFVNPIIELLTGTIKDMRTWQVHKDALTKTSKIVAVVPRRKSLIEDIPEWKFVATKVDSNARFKKHYFVSYDETGYEATKAEKKERLESILRFLQEYHRRGPNAYHSRIHSVADDKKLFILPEDYDRTPSELERWDERILDIDVARIMKLILQPTPSKDFFEEAPELADNFYSAPFCKIAQQEFGYEG